MTTTSAANTYIFGYGSLLQLESLKATVPSARNLRPVYIKGFRREFTLWDSIGWTETNLDLAGIPFCGVDVCPVNDKNSLVNGVVFEVSEADLPALLEREKEYELVEVTAYDFTTHKPVGTCMVFSANRQTGEYDFNSAAQKRYLDVCLEGAEQYGEEFLSQFILTTFIGDKSLNRISTLNIKPTTFRKSTKTAELEIYKIFSTIAEGYNKQFAKLQLPLPIKLEVNASMLTLPYYDGETFNEKWNESNGGSLLGLDLAKDIVEVIKDLSLVDTKQFINNKTLATTSKFIFEHQEARTYYTGIADKFLKASLIDSETYKKVIKLLSYKQTSNLILSNGDFYARNFIKLPNTRLLLIDWESWGDYTSPFYMIDHSENVAAVFYAHMWGNPAWQKKYVEELQILFDFDQAGFQKGIIIKTLGLANFWYSELEENNLTKDQLKLLTRTLTESKL